MFIASLSLQEKVKHAEVEDIERVLMAFTEACLCFSYRNVIHFEQNKNTIESVPDRVQKLIDKKLRRITAFCFCFLVDPCDSPCSQEKSSQEKGVYAAHTGRLNLTNCFSSFRGAMSWNWLRKAVEESEGEK